MDTASEDELRSLILAYLHARRYVENAGFGYEIEYQERQRLGMLTEARFLAELSWVVLAGGMRDSVIRRRYPAVAAAFFNWQSALAIRDSRAACRERALLAFNHPGKIDAIISACEWVARFGVNEIHRGLEEVGPVYLCRFSHIGPTTSLHLAKNLGLSIAKPDRHLMRIADAVDITFDEMCKSIAHITGHPEDVVDSVLWRFATLEANYVGYFAKGVHVRT